jgi:hypothetical protein
MRSRSLLSRPCASSLRSGLAKTRIPASTATATLLFLNGHDVPDAKAWKPGDQLEISNPEPYARKIEVGAMKVNVDGHVYERSAQIVRRQYGSSVKVEFVFMPLRFGNHRRRRRAGSPRGTPVAPPSAAAVTGWCVSPPLF